MANVNERTYVMIKPDGVQRGLIGEIIKRFEQRGYHLAALKMVQVNNKSFFFFQIILKLLIQPTEERLKQHYADLSAQPFFAGLVSYMAKGPVVCMVWTGLNAIKGGRVLLGETNPLNSATGSIRGDFCIQTGRNLIHGSDSVESAEKEIALWFTQAEIVAWQSCASSWLYEQKYLSFMHLVL